MWKTCCILMLVSSALSKEKDGGAGFVQKLVDIKNTLGLSDLTKFQACGGTESEESACPGTSKVIDTILGVIPFDIGDKWVQIGAAKLVILGGLGTAIVALLSATGVLTFTGITNAFQFLLGSLARVGTEDVSAHEAEHYHINELNDYYPEGYNYNEAQPVDQERTKRTSELAENFYKGFKTYNKINKINNE